MKRFLTIVAATAVAAAITIPALADSGSPADELGTFAACLRTHGIPVPADLEGVAIKQWIGEHEDLAGLKEAFDACDPNPRHGVKDDGVAPEQLRACLREKGLDAPASLNALKPWIFEQSKTDAGKAALTACGFAVDDKKPVEEGGPCGDAKAESADKARASRARKPRAQTTPTT
jgi:hypothetical protein